MITIRLLHLVTGPATEFDGQYVVDYDPTPLDNGDVLLSTSAEAAGARHFESVGEALEFWRQESTKGPRPDGKPDRPLTAYTVEIG